METYSNMWEATVALMDRWAQRPVDHEPAQYSTDEAWMAWNSVRHAVEEHFENRQNGTLDDFDNQWIAQQVEAQDALPSWDNVHAVAWGLDTAGWASFTGDWLKEGEYRELAAGDRYPVSDIDTLIVGHDVTSRPGSLANDIEELPHLRILRECGLRVVFDARFSIELRGALELLDRIVTVHPNVDLDEFHIPTNQPFHGVRPADIDRQRQLLTGALERSIDDGSLIVLPELCVTEELVDDIQAILDSKSAICLVVAGSYHGVENHDQVNVACALLAELGQRMTHRKLVALESHDRREGIVLGTELRVWVAGPWRFAMAICKDVISPDSQQLFARLGANVLAVPAMSSKVDPFQGAVGSLATQTQGFVAVANNPCSWPNESGKRRVRSALFGQPFPDRTLVMYPPPGVGEPAGRGTCTLVVGDVEAYWQPL